RTPTRHAAGAEQLQQHLDSLAQLGACLVNRRGLAGFRPTPSPRPIHRMFRIERQAIEPKIGTETVQLDEPLCRIVTGLAKRLEGAEPEFVYVAVVRLDVIADRRRCDDGAL